MGARRFYIDADDGCIAADAHRADLAHIERITQLCLERREVRARVRLVNRAQGRHRSKPRDLLDRPAYADADYKRRAGVRARPQYGIDNELFDARHTCRRRQERERAPESRARTLGRRLYLHVVEPFFNLDVQKRNVHASVVAQIFPGEWVHYHRTHREFPHSHLVHGLIERFAQTAAVRESEGSLYEKGRHSGVLADDGVLLRGGERVFDYDIEILLRSAVRLRLPRAPKRVYNVRLNFGERAYPDRFHRCFQLFFSKFIHKGSTS